MKKNTIKLFSVSLLVFFLLSPIFALAAPSETMKNLKNTGLVSLGGAQGNSAGLATFIGNIVATLLGFLGVVFVILVIWAGFQWMTAGGDTGKVGKSKTLLINAVIGLVIILASYGLTYFVIDVIGSAATSSPGAVSPK